MKDDRITDTMNLAEAFNFLTSQQQNQLSHWAQTFGVALKDFHAGHLLTYEQERLQSARPEKVYSEISALLSLLKDQGLGEEIDLPPRIAKPRLSPIELSELSPQVRSYISHLESQISALRAQADIMKSQIRRSNWARPR